MKKSEIPNDGAYISEGIYDHKEIVRMTNNLSQAIDIPVATLLEVFSIHLFG